MSTEGERSSRQSMMQPHQQLKGSYTDSNRNSNNPDIEIGGQPVGGKIIPPRPSLDKISTGSYRNSGVRASTTDYGGDDNIDNGNESIHLNAYSIYPTTIPPFALDQEFQKLKAKDALFNDNPIHEVSHGHYRGTDQFLSYENSKWENFVSVIGSNVAYTTDTRINLAPKSRASRPQSIELHNDMASITPEEAELIRKEVLTDLTGKWSGDERLKALDNIPIGGDYKFKREKDKKDWMDYVSRVKRLYYGRVSLGTKNAEDETLDHTDWGERRPSGVSWSTVGRPAEWMDDLSKERERWRQLKKKKMQKWKPKLFRLLIDNQYLPLCFRLVICICCCVSLGLAIRIYQNSEGTIHSLGFKIEQQPSTIMAICVNSIAVFYTFYIAIDEFSGQPLGLKDPLSKLRLILLDLLFIIFSSANLSLAFNTRYDKEWVCTTYSTDNRLYKYPKVGYICRKQKALSAFLFILLFLWVEAFTISIIRVVEKVSSNLSTDSN